MEIQENIPLAPFTTFKIGGPARFFAEAETVEDIGNALAFAKEHSLPILVLGGGSNMLISDAGFPGFVIQVVSKGIREIQNGGEDNVLVEIGAGEVWDDVVAWAAERGYWGIENLSHIPGSCGAFPVQNVGAYGAEASQVVETVDVYDMEERRVLTMSNAECGFGYRRSVFNTEKKGRFVILSTRLRLTRKTKPNLSYADLEKTFERRDPTSISLLEIREAVIRIREDKFPYPREAKNGSAGSFFKAVLVDKDTFSKLEETIPRGGREEYALKFQRYAKHTDPTARIKVPCAFLIDAFGLKGMKQGGAFLNPSQPVVILNDGSARSQDVLGLFRAVRVAIHRKCGLRVENEPELVGFTPAQLEEAYRT